MLFEALTTVSMTAVAGGSYMYQHKQATDDHARIKTVADELGLTTRQGGIQLQRKRVAKHGENMSEYVYKMPLGLAYHDFIKNKHVFEDGLNNKSVRRLSLQRLKQISWRNGPASAAREIKNLLQRRVRHDKHIDVHYDGMLRFRVYEENLSHYIPLEEALIYQRGPWDVPIGETLTDTVYHDFDGVPHMLVGGTTDMGKSTLMNIMLVSLLAKQPERTTLTLLDLKGGLEMNAYKHLRQTKHFATDPETALEALEDVQQDMSAVFDRLAASGKKNIKQLGDMPRHFVFVDEAAELMSSGEKDNETKETKIACEAVIKDIARRGRAAGVRLIYATQYPTGEVINQQVKRNMLTRVAFVVDDDVASRVVLDRAGADELPLVRGRAIYKQHAYHTMQTYFLDDDNSELKARLIRANQKSSDKRDQKEVSDAHDTEAGKLETERGYTHQFEEL